MHMLLQCIAQCWCWESDCSNKVSGHPGSSLQQFQVPEDNQCGPATSCPAMILSDQFPAELCLTQACKKTCTKCSRVQHDERLIQHDIVAGGWQERRTQSAEAETVLVLQHSQICQTAVTGVRTAFALIRHRHFRSCIPDVL